MNKIEFKISNEIGTNFYTKEFYFSQNFYILLFTVILNNQKFSKILPMYLEGVNKIIFVQGNSYQKEEIINDLDLIKDYSGSKILLIENKYQQNFKDLIQKYNLIFIDFSKYSFNDPHNIKSLFLLEVMS